MLNEVTLIIKQGDFITIVGPSGCGKSTLLHTLLGLENPTQGKVTLFGSNLYDLTSDQRAEVRKQHVGIVYQQPYWIKSLSVLENTAFPLLLLGQERSDATTKASKLLEMVGMKSWSGYVPTELSSGQQQKVQLARALTTDPKLIVTDEPTGNLDTKSGSELMGLLKQLNRDKKTILMVTHDLEYLKYSTRILRMLDGKIEKEHRGKITDAHIRDLIKHNKKGNNGL